MKSIGSILNTTKKRVIAGVVAFIIVAAAVLTPILIVTLNKDTDPQGDPVIEESEIDLVRSGNSDYSIVIPADASETLQFAADELVSVFKQSTGVQLPVINDLSVTGLNGKYLSVGDTVLKTQADVSTEDLTDDAFIITLRDNTLIMAGGGDTGSLYAVYEFLERELGYKFYAYDEVKIPEVFNAKMLAFEDYVEIPTMAKRSMFSPQVVNIPNAGLRLRAQQMLETVSMTGWPHSHHRFVPPETYPQFYDGEALCLTNTEMWDVAVSAAIETFDNNPDLEYVMIAAEDNFNICGCAECTAQRAKYTQAGIDIIFLNYVAEKVQEHYDALDGRKVNIAALAYNDTQNPPVIRDEQGNYTPIDEKVIPVDNLWVQVCFMFQDWAHSFTDKSKNSVVENQMSGWRSLTKNLFTYLYDGWEVNNNMLYFYDWEYKAETIDALKANGYEHVYWEIASRNTKIGSFDALRTYYTAQLSWDSSQNTAELISDFIANYYKQAAPYVQFAFDTINANFKVVDAKFEKENKVLTQCVQLAMNRYLFDTELWPEQMLRQIIDALEEGRRAIQAADLPNDEKIKLDERVLREQVVMRYYLLYIYKARFNPDEYAALVEQYNEDVTSLGGLNGSGGALTV